MDSFHEHGENIRQLCLEVSNLADHLKVEFENYSKGARKTIQEKEDFISILQVEINRLQDLINSKS